MERLKKYKTILIDPPWEQTMSGQYKTSRNSRPKSLSYPTMNLDEIKALPISEISDIGCHLWLWTTNEFLHEGFHCLEKWGFKYLAPIHWKKHSGLGNWFVHLTQTCLFAYYKKCEFNRGRYEPNYLETNVNLKHSRKPAEMYELIEKISDPPRIELFARTFSPMFSKRPGWNTWGNEA
jgi:N6-adenosine-specific RNA methylase IME4